MATSGQDVELYITEPSDPVLDELATTHAAYAALCRQAKILKMTTGLHDIEVMDVVRHNRCWLRAERSVSSGQMESGRRGRRDPEPTPLLGRRARVHHGTYPAQTCRLVDQSSGRHSEPSSMRVD